jgi:GNAT superfamily N-acetyltransferase
MSDMAHREELLARMAGSIQSWQRALGSAAEGGQVVEIGEVVGSIVPIAASRSILNAAAGPLGMTFDVALIEQLAARYQAAGASAWGVWLHEEDAVGCALLERTSLRIDSRPRAMAIELDGFRPAGAPESINVATTTDLAVVAEPLSAGYGFPPELLTRGLPDLLRFVEASVAWIDGVPAAAALVARDGDDAGVFMVATAPEFRGRGAAGAVMANALLHARENGCVTSTLQASVMGQPVYARLGYQDLGAYLLWEHRE